MKNVIDIINDIQNQFTFDKNKKLLDIFISDCINEESPQEIDYDKGVVVYHDYIYSFDSILKRFLNNYLLKIKKSFDIISLNSKFTYKEIKYIESSLKYIIRDQQKLFKDFPLYFEFLENIIDYLNNKYQIYISIEEDYNSFFDIKEQYALNIFFKELYIITEKHELIEDDTQDSFISVFLYKETSSTIHFIVNTPLIVCFLEMLNPIFNNFNARVIEESKRFLTKKGVLLSQTNYNRNKNKMNGSSIKTCKHLQNDVNELLEKYPIS